jgi:hypothetical protein
MAWKKVNGHRYFYRSFRMDGQVQTLYFGRGEAAQCAADMLSVDRYERKVRATLAKAEREDLEEIDRQQATRWAQVEIVVRAALELAGFHRHCRGAWRRRRRQMSEETQGQQAALPAADGFRKPPASLDEIRDVVGRAQQGDQSAVGRLREFMQADPDGMFLAVSADLARLTQDVAITGMIGSKNLATGEGIAAKLEAIRQDLAGPGATGVERLLAERVALCYLDVHDWDIRHNQANDTGTLSARDHEHYQRMRTNAHQRYMSALKTLAMVRKMGPAVQINFAKNQVNMAG